VSYDAGKVGGFRKMKATVGYLALVALCAGCSSPSGPEIRPGAPRNHRLLYETFQTESAAADFVMTDPKAWRISREEGRGALELFTQSKYSPAVRSPVNIALIRDRVLSDFVLEVELVQTGKEYGHRDMCLFFGVQSSTNFYYTHLASAADDHAHNIFIVHGASRTKIAQETTTGVD
jgi:hypothetical protein